MKNLPYRFLKENETHSRQVFLSDRLVVVEVDASTTTKTVVLKELLKLLKIT